MAKVHAVRVGTTPKANTVRFNKVSLAYSCLFVVNFVTEPLKAYISEPLPWTINSAHLHDRNRTFDEFVTSTYNSFSAKYNNRTLSASAMFAHDKGDNTVVLRYNMTLPASNPVDRCYSYLIYFPGSMLYGEGIVQFVCNFLAQNASTRLIMPRYMCQHLTLAGSIVLGDACVWIEPLPTPGTFSVNHVLQVVESPPWCWMKFALRLLIAGVTMGEVWRLYYRHYGSLISNLKLIGIHNDGPHILYDVHVGDPTWIILSHPYICMAMMVDILYSTAYSVTQLFRVCQLQNLWQFAVGSFCNSNFVWASYTTMRYTTSLIKHFHWELYFEPLDPGILALTSAFYAGPFLYLICQSPLILMFQFLIQLLPTMKMEAMEVSLGMLVYLLLFASIPLLQAAISRFCRRRKERRQQPSKSLVQFNSIHFNDWKHFLVLVLQNPTLPALSKTGGTLYTLFDQTPQYRKFPLYSPRGSDCFVREVDTRTGRIVGQFRLSLLYGLDFQCSDSSLRIATCTRPHVGKAVCVCDSQLCYKAALKSHKFVVHPGAAFALEGGGSVVLSSQIRVEVM
ncbi:Aste57867_19755 [Aphanomyces stellatus]|uniref:Aste57867_19755 protein n=1 Tax=Aphanomyces stellatus TaxID=120398 RepID=A0A485LDV1_9STRA|nr:hypothetical protein As57867_019690 [Aphanomyces stellatus]VFT96453.1 Aste57867_19755 [Aphanomyces stellatus]